MTVVSHMSQAETKKQREAAPIRMDGIFVYHI